MSVLEARDRIGGRIWTSQQWSGVPLDLGASWIHGIDENPITDLAKKAGAKTVVTDLDSATDYLADGREIEGAQAQALQRWQEATAKALSSFQKEDDEDASIRSVVQNALGWSDLSNSVTVTTHKGAFQADHVVVTLPLGVLQSGAVTFGPGLPQPKTTAVSKLGMGVLNKCYLRFPKVFWADTGWLEYVPDVDEYGRWAQWVNVARLTGQPALLGFNAADFGRTIGSWSATEIVDSAMSTLKTIYGSGIPAPTGYQITRCASDPYAHGSYSFTKLGATSDMRDQLAASVDGRVHFAGEATDRKDHATVHGAYRSGLLAAKKIAGWTSRPHDTTGVRPPGPHRAADNARGTAAPAGASPEHTDGACRDQHRARTHPWLRRADGASPRLRKGLRTPLIATTTALVFGGIAWRTPGADSQRPATAAW
ncbi:NAD(P)-binding protein [Streptomyces sp. GS7]|nr:NAD(P)-binding protein [Streptomyces sp. GS7]